MQLAGVDRVESVLEIVCLHDPDMDRLSPSHLQRLFRLETIDALRSRLQALQVIQCEGLHDDPASCRTRDTCPLRELNLACGHQDLTVKTDLRHRVEKEWKTPLAVILTTCHTLFRTPHRVHAELLASQARKIADTLYLGDAAGYLSYHRLREDRVFTPDELTGFPAGAWSHPFASIDNIPDLKAALADFELEYGRKLEAIRDEVLQLLESVSAPEEKSASVVA